MPTPSRQQILEAIGYRSADPTPASLEYGSFEGWEQAKAARWARTAAEADGEMLLTALLDAVTSPPDWDGVSPSVYVRQEYVITDVGEALSDLAWQNGDHVLNRIFERLGQLTASEGRAALIESIGRITYPTVTPFINLYIAKISDLGDMDLLWLATAVGDSRGPGSERLLQVLLARTSGNDPEVCNEIASRIEWVRTHGERDAATATQYHSARSLIAGIGRRFTQDDAGSAVSSPARSRSPSG